MILMVWISSIDLIIWTQEIFHAPSKAQCRIPYGPMEAEQSAKLVKVSDLITNERSDLFSINILMVQV